MLTFFCKNFIYFRKFDTFSVKFTHFSVQFILLSCYFHTFFLLISHSFLKNVHFFFKFHTFVCKFSLFHVKFELFSVNIALFKTTISSMGFCYFHNVRLCVGLGLCFIEYVQTQKIKSLQIRLLIGNHLMNRFNQYHTFVSVFNLFLSGSNYIQLLGI